MGTGSVRRDIAVIGASAGGFDAVDQIVHALPPSLPLALLVVLHRSAFFDVDLAALLSRHGTCAPVSEPENGERLEHGHIYVAPRDLHMTVQDGHLILDRSPKQHRTRPAIDPLCFSIARHYRERTIGILLSGGGEDGTDGLTAISAAGGITAVQNPDEAAHSQMPGTALRRDHVHLVLRLDDIAPTLLRLAEGADVATVANN